MRLEDLGDLIEMSEEDWENNNLTQHSNVLSLDRSAFTPSSPAPAVPPPLFSGTLTASSHAATGAAKLPLLSSESQRIPVEEQAPPKKKARLHVAGTPVRSSSSQVSIAAARTVSSTSLGAAGLVSHGAGPSAVVSLSPFMTQHVLESLTTS